MSNTYRRASSFVATLGLAAAVFPAAARNTEHLMPIESTLATPAARAAIGEDVTFSFGAALPDGFVITQEVKARGVADPRPSALARDPQQLSDEEACSNAFITAVAHLAKQARANGSKTVLGIVSHYDDKVRDNKEQYECHSGQTRSVVDLKAMLAAPGRAGEVTIAAKGVVSTKHRGAVPPASHFAEVDDLGAVPLNEAGRERYRHYLTLPMPKAFVIFEGGTAWRFYHGDPDATTKALDYCQQVNKTCWLYAVDHRVVWRDSPARRIGRSSQLGNE